MIRGRLPAVGVALGRGIFPFLHHRTYFEIRVNFSKFKIEGRDRFLAQADPHSRLPSLESFGGKAKKITSFEVIYYLIQRYHVNNSCHQQSHSLQSQRLI